MNEKYSREDEAETRLYQPVPVVVSQPPSPHKDDIDAAPAEVGVVENATKEFDPYAFGNQKNPTSFWGVVVHLFIVAASPTIMNIPATFEDVGYVTGFIGSLTTVVFYATCMHTIVSIDYALCKKLQRSTLSYADIIYYSFVTGPKRMRGLANAAKVMVYVNFLCVWAGGNAVYVLMVSENAKFIHDSLYRMDVGMREVMLYVSVPLVLLCWIPNLRLLVVCSTFANLVNTGCLAIIFYVSIVDFPSLENRVAVGKLSGVPLFLGTALITINGTGIIMPLKNQLKDPRKFASKFGVLNVSYVPVGLLYAFFGLVCYLKYGHSIKDNVVLNMPESHPKFGNFFIGMYTLGIVFFYPLASYVSFDIVWNDLLKGRLQKKNAFTYTLCNYSCKTITALSSIVLAYWLPDIKLFVSLTGTVGTSLDSIIFPSVAEILVRSSDDAYRKKLSMGVKNGVFILLGLILCVAGLWDSLSTIVR